VTRATGRPADRKLPLFLNPSIQGSTVDMTDKTHHTVVSMLEALALPYHYQRCHLENTPIDALHVLIRIPWRQEAVNSMGERLQSAEGEISQAAHSEYR
jgi:hypothetical protein